MKFLEVVILVLNSFSSKSTASLFWSIFQILKLIIVSFIFFAVLIISSLFVGNYDVISEDFNIEYGLEKKGDINFWSAKLVSKNSTLASYIKEVNISGTHSKNSEQNKFQDSEQ